MKKLQKLVLNKAVKMTVPQMKHITGGYDGNTCGTTCGGSPCTIWVEHGGQVYLFAGKCTPYATTSVCVCTEL